jgi:tetratricopeptide (TPR) repeat protein
MHPDPSPSAAPSSGPRLRRPFASLGGRRAPVAFVLAGLVLSFLAFSPVLRAPYLYDDESIVERGVLQRFAGEEHRGWHSFFEGLVLSPRPLRQLTHRIEGRLFGPRPVPMHVVNLLLHLGVALAGFFLLRTLRKGDGAAFAAALLFLLNPVVVETAGILSHRKESLSALFCLCALIVVLRGNSVRRPPPRPAQAEEAPGGRRRSWLARAKAGWPRSRRWGLTALLLFLALAGKETAVVFPLLWVAVTLPDVLSPEPSDESPPRSSVWRAYLSTLAGLCLLTAVLGVLFALQIRGGMMEAGWQPYASGVRAGHFTGHVPFSASLAAAFRAFAAYLLSFVRMTGHTIHPNVAGWGSWRTPAAAVSLAVALAYLVLLVLLRRDRRFFPPLAWIAAALSPYLLPPLLRAGHTALFADRYAYLASFGFAWLVVEGARALCHRLLPRRACPPVLGLLCAAATACLVAFSRAAALPYRSNEAFWAHAVRCDPTSVQARYNLAYALWKERGDLPAAEAEFRRMAQMDPSFAYGIRRMSDFLAAQGRFQDALDALDASLAHIPWDTGLRARRARCLFHLGDLPRSLAEYEALERAGCGGAVFHADFGDACRASLLWAETRRHYETAARENGDADWATRYTAFTQDPPPRGGNTLVVFGDPLFADGLSRQLPGWDCRVLPLPGGTVGGLNADFRNQTASLPPADRCVLVVPPLPAALAANEPIAARLAMEVAGCVFKARMAGMRPVVVGPGADAESPLARTLGASLRSAGVPYAPAPPEDFAASLLRDDPPPLPPSGF